MHEKGRTEQRGEGRKCYVRGFNPRTLHLVSAIHSRAFFMQTLRSQHTHRDGAGVTEGDGTRRVWT